MTAAATRAWPPLLAVLLVVGLATALLLLRGPSPEDARATVEEATPESAADRRPIEPPPPAAVPRAERRALPTDEAASADRLDADARPGYPVEFHGRVVRAEDGRPIADAAVEIHGWDRTTRTDADGRFSLTLAWTRALLVRAPGRAPRIVEGDDAHAPPAPPLEVRLGLGGTVRLAFDDRRAAIGERSLVARVDRSVAWTDPGGLVTPPERWGEAAFHAPLDARGWASLPDLPTGVPLILTVDEEGRPLHAVERGLVLAPGEVVRFERRLGGPTVVAGTVVSARDGRPLPEQVVLLFDASRRGEGDVGDRRYATVADRLHYGSRDSGTPAVLRSTADANGRFRWTDVAPGRYEIGAGAGNPLPTVSLDIAPGTPIAEVTVPVPDLEIRGTVLSPEGTPNPHSIVSAIPTNEPQVIHSRTDAHGRFRIAPVWPGRFRIRAWAPHRGGGPAEVEVEAGATDVVLRLPAGASVSGTVRDAKTGAGIRATVLAAAADPRAASLSTISDPEGRFELNGLPAGTVSLSASTETGLAAVGPTFDLVAGATRTDLDLRLTPGAWLELALSEQGPQAHATVRTGATVVARLPLSPTAKPTVVPANVDLTIEASVGPDRIDRTLRLAPEERRRLVFEKK